MTALAELDARAWAQLLRALRRLPEPPAAIGDALARPAGDLSTGPARRTLCEAIVSSADVLAVLRADDALPAAIHRAIDPGPAADPDRSVVEHPSACGGGGAGEGDGVDDRRAGREHALRQELSEERRRREGAEVRAAAALARVEELSSERDRALARAAELQEELVRVRDAVAQATARAERRSTSRIEQLEAGLAEERRAAAALRREQERSRVELDALRAELATLRARPRARTASASAGEGEDRPLVLPAELEEGTTEAARWLADRARLLLVDGYNAALLLRPNRPLDEQRRWLVDRLRPLVARGTPEPVVVFDGDRPSGTLKDTGGVEVRFSPSGVIADDDIVFAVAATDDPVLVVTDDAELRERVRAEGGNVIGVVHLLGVVDG